MGEKLTLMVQVELAVSEDGQVVVTRSKSRPVWLEPWFKVLISPRLPLAVTA